MFQASQTPSVFALRLLKVLSVLLVLKVVLGVVGNYRHFFPPDFRQGFLQDRQAYFFGAYACAFYAHVTSGPLSLLLGLVLISGRVRRRAPVWHRVAGRVQVVNVLILVVPGGLWMARFADSGAIAGVGFASLAIVTGLCAVQGWRFAVSGKFSVHRIWMERLFVLLCSAVVLRVCGGLASVFHWDSVWLYPATAWLSWLGPLVIYELFRRSVPDWRLPVRRD